MKYKGFNVEFTLNNISVVSSPLWSLSCFFVSGFLSLSPKKNPIFCEVRKIVFFQFNWADSSSSHFCCIVFIPFKKQIWCNSCRNVGRRNDTQQGNNRRSRRLSAFKRTLQSHTEPATPGSAECEPQNSRPARLHQSTRINRLNKLQRSGLYIKTTCLCLSAASSQSIPPPLRSHSPHYPSCYIFKRLQTN